MKVCILVWTGHIEQHDTGLEQAWKERIQNIKNLEHFKNIYDFYFLRGDDASTTITCIDNQILYPTKDIPLPQHIELGLPGQYNKTLESLLYCIDSLQPYDLYVRTNVHCCLVFDKLTKVLQDLPKTLVYTGDRCSCECGIILSRDVIQSIGAYYKTMDYWEGYDDKGMGIIAMKLGIPFKPMDDEKLACLNPRHIKATN